MYILGLRVGDGVFLVALVTVLDIAEESEVQLMGWENITTVYNIIYYINLSLLRITVMTSF